MAGTRATMIDVGQTVGNYNITAAIGAGGMGTVFLAEHPLIGSKVALKAIHPEYALSPEVFARFVNEAKAVNQIGHDHIVDITDFGTSPSGDFYFMMEYLEGETLSGAIKKNGALAPARALNIAAQIADALSASHEHGVVHRDLKPDNVFLIVRDDVEDFVKVLDFGLAKLTNPDEIATYESRAGTVMGTPYYMSPEQCEGRADIDARADVYALGVILFEMLTGMIPFGGEGYGEILVKHVTVPAPPARSLVPDLPMSLEAIVSRSLAKAPSQRFQTMAEFREALLDPERFATSDPWPAMAMDDLDLSGRVRAANPMARTEVALQPVVGPQPTSSAAPAGRGPSTFRDSVGEVWTRGNSQILKPKTHRVRNLVLVVALASTAAAGVRYRHQATRFLDGAAALASASRHPAGVRVKINSDPEGATVERADGTRLGLTPLETDVPFGEFATAYLFHKDGYLPKTASFVPNAPSKVYEVLQRDDPGPRPEAAPPVVEPLRDEPPATLAEAVNLEPPPPLKKPSSKHAGRRHARPPAEDPPSALEPQRDETMAPTVTPTETAAPTD